MFTRAALCSTVLMIDPDRQESGLPLRRAHHADEAMVAARATQEQPKEDDMNTLPLLQQDTHANLKSRTKGRRRLEEAQTWGVIIGLVGGITAAVLGSLLTAAGWMTADAGAKHWLATTGTVLLCLTIPLIVLGACCLDWMEKDKSPSQSQAARYDDDDDDL